MVRLKAAKFGVVQDDYSLCIGFDGENRGSPCHVVLSATLVPEQSGDASLDGLHLEVGGQGVSDYDWVRCVEFADINRLVLSLTEEGKQALSTTSVEIKRVATFDWPSEALGRICEMTGIELKGVRRD